MEELVVSIRIEEDNQLALKKGGSVESSKVHVLEFGQASKNKGKGETKERVRVKT